MNRDLVIPFKGFRQLFGGSEGRASGTERLGPLLADPTLVRSLREDDHRRRRLFLILASGLVGLLLGAGGALLALHPWRPVASGGESVARLLATQGQTFWRAKELDRAVSHSRLAVELAPGLADTWDALALSLFYSGQTVEAEQAAWRCLKINPGYERAYHILGSISFYLGDWKQAETYWKRSNAPRPLSRLLLLESRFEEAEPLVRQLVRDRPDDPYTRVMSEAVQLGRLTPEIQHKLAPDFVASRDPETARGWELFYARRYEEAAASFSRAVNRSPRDGSALIGRAWCLLKIGPPREAQSAFEQALVTWPSSYSALNGLAWSRKAQGQSEGAVTLWRQVVEDLPRTEQMEVPSCFKGLGAVYYERGDYARAHSYLTRSMLGDPYDPETRELLQSTLRKLSPP
jgi:Flp pilus assembly protein TadD